MAQQGYDDDLLRRWFPGDEEQATKPLTESDIREISDVLKRGSRETWSRIPRIYSVLRKIDQLHTIQAFVDNGITDVSFPFTKSTLPEALCDHSARLKFLELQNLVYNTEALRLERYAHHGHFRDPSEVPLKRIGDLGKGGFGYVDHVVSTISNKEYARKLISRGKTFRKDKQVLQAFVRELASLKRLSHRHLVSLVGSYTDRKFVAVVMTPVADCNLEVLLERGDPGAQPRPFLRSFFGCLASAVGYLHDSSIRHKDIKPSNILIKHDQVYLTDFGTCLDWSELGTSITATAPPTTPRYCAPEVMAYTERSSMSDMWSLGCVFLEMWTVVKQHTLEDMKAYMICHGSRTRDYHSNIEGWKGWMDVLLKIPGPGCDEVPRAWILNLLQHQSNLRWSIHTLEDRVREATMDPLARFAYTGLCCLDADDDASSSNASYEFHPREDTDSHALDASHALLQSKSSVVQRSSRGVKEQGEDVSHKHGPRGDLVAMYSAGVGPTKSLLHGTASPITVMNKTPDLTTPSEAGHQPPLAGESPSLVLVENVPQANIDHSDDQERGLPAMRQGTDGTDGSFAIGRSEAADLPETSASASLPDPSWTTQYPRVETRKTQTSATRRQEHNRTFTKTDRTAGEVVYLHQDDEHASSSSAFGKRTRPGVSPVLGGTVNDGPEPVLQSDRSNIRTPSIIMHDRRKREAALEQSKIEEESRSGVKRAHYPGPAPTSADSAAQRPSHSNQQPRQPYVHSSPPAALRQLERPFQRPFPSVSYSPWFTQRSSPGVLPQLELPTPLSSQSQDASASASNSKPRSKRTKAMENNTPGTMAVGKNGTSSVNNARPSALGPDLLSSNANRRAGTSSINDPKLLATVENAIRRLILPELNALKEENRTAQNRDKFERMPREIPREHKTTRYHDQRSQTMSGNRYHDNRPEMKDVYQENTLRRREANISPPRGRRAVRTSRPDDEATTNVVRTCNSSVKPHARTPEETGRPVVEENESCAEPASQQDYPWIDGATYLHAQPSRPTNAADRDNESMIAHVDYTRYAKE